MAFEREFKHFPNDWRIHIVGPIPDFREGTKRRKIALCVRDGMTVLEWRKRTCRITLGGNRPDGRTLRRMVDVGFIAVGKVSKNRGTRKASQKPKNGPLVANVEAQILDLYRQVHRQANGCDYAGFNILNGPPIVGGPMVVSLNPGLSAKTVKHDADNFWPDRWPDQQNYLRGISPFAKKLCATFESAGIDLKGVNAGYALVFRSKSYKQWENEVPLNLRKSAEQFSLKMLTTLISILKPNFLYAVGFKTLKLMGCVAEREQYGQHNTGKKFVLLRYGNFEGTRMIASPHLSGYRLSQKSLDQVARALSRMPMPPA